MSRHLFICLLSILVLNTGLTEARTIDGSRIEQLEGFHGNQGGFRPGTGLGSKSSSETFKNTVLGGDFGGKGGFVIYEAGKSIIKSAKAPFIYNARVYQWDTHGDNRSTSIQCSMPLSQLVGLGSTTSTTASPDGSTTVVPSTTSPDQVLQNIQYQNGSRPEKIVWSCRRGREVCCGTDCCPADPEFNYSSEKSTASEDSTGLFAGFIALILIVFWAALPFGIPIILILIVILLCLGCCTCLVSCCRAIFCCDDKQQVYINYSHSHQQGHPCSV